MLDHLGMSDHTGSPATLETNRAYVWPDDEHVLIVDQVSKQWPGKSACTLDHLGLNVEPGEVIGIVGANGAGKTTFLRILAGIIDPEKGGVLLLRGGVSPARRRRDYQRRVGLLSAGDRGLYARMSVASHIDLWARLSLIAGKQQRRQAGRLALERFRLDELASSRVDRLSMGQRQRLRLALTFLHEPDVVLFDEPTNSLDGEGIALMRQAVDVLLARGGACIWVGPEGVPPSLASNRVLRLREGRLGE